MPRTQRELFQGLENERRIRPGERRRLLRGHRYRSRPIVVQWMLDGGALIGLYVLGYVGAGFYWRVLEGVWGPGYELLLGGLGHAIPAVVVGMYTGALFRRGRFFFLMGPVVLVGATFYREVYLRLGGADALGLPMWMYWAACGEALLAGGIAMLIGAWMGENAIN